jgi:hypothetical protein
LSRVRHLIGDLEAPPLENGEVQAKTAFFLLYHSQLETDHQLLSGRREDLLRKVKSAWKVARRTIVPCYSPADLRARRVIRQPEARIGPFNPCTARNELWATFHDTSRPFQ